MPVMDRVSPGENAPEEFNVIVEIPMNSDPVKYEFDEKTGTLFVDRFMTTAMYYPANYGYVPQTLSGDGDPVDVLVVTPYPLQSGVGVTCRAVGMLKMEDEAGIDGKVLAVPVTRVLPMYAHWKDIENVNPMRLNAISHFFQHYKDLEQNKWAKVLGWDGVDAAHREVTDGIAAYQKTLRERG
ncbi:MAG: inorganic diphosphatase [Ottowia sp.]|nr:inorganic diphosphatase [Ottowia sp.]